MEELLKVILKYQPNRNKAVKLAEELADRDFIKPVYGNPGIHKVCQAFKKAFGTTTVSSYDRYAANRLCAKYKPEDLIKVINLLADHLNDKYCPVISSLSQLEQKWISVRRFITSLRVSDIQL